MHIQHKKTNSRPLRKGGFFTDHYLAFISYRHRKSDQKVSFQLRKDLESFHLPESCGIPKKRKCFRDTDELPTSPDLGADIEHALEDSDYLIAVCSEEYVKSRWCMREVDLFIAQGRKDRILPVLVSGDENTSIPEQIRELPVALDLRGMNSRQIREKIPELFSAMTGVEASEIAACDRRHRNMVRAGVFGGIAAAILLFTAYAALTARRIQDNNVKIARATEDAIDAEIEAGEQIKAYHLKKAGYTAHKAWTAIGRRDQRQALIYATEALADMDYEDEAWMYVDEMPESVEAADALRMALAMPEQKRVKYEEEGYGTHFLQVVEDFITPEDYDAWFNEEVEEVSFLSKPTGRYIVSYPQWKTAPDFSQTTYIFETDSPAGICYRLAYTEEGEWMELDTTVRKFLLPGSVTYLAGGEPLEAERVWDSPGKEYFIARTGGRNLLYAKDQPEAICELPVSGTPSYVVFNHAATQAAVTDDAGHVSLFLTADGRSAGELPGSYRYVTYANENYRLYAVTEDGVFERINTMTFETERTYELPQPVRTLCYSAVRDRWLAAGDYCWFVLDGTTGEILDGYVSEELPEEENAWGSGKIVSCFWQGFDEKNYTHDANGFLLLYERGTESHRVVLGEANGNALVNDQLPQDCIHAFYSADGGHVFLQYGNGDLSCWSVDDGVLAWVLQSGSTLPAEYRRKASISPDGAVIWRFAGGDAGIDRILIYSEEHPSFVNGSTVWTTEYSWDNCLYWRTELPTGPDCGEIVEDPYTTRALYPGEKNGTDMAYFDYEDCEVLWSRPYAGEAAFDGSTILCLEVMDAGEGKRELVLREIDSDEGELTGETVLCELEENEAGEIRVDREELTATVDGIWVVDLAERTVKKEKTAPPEEPALTFAGENVVARQENGRNLLVNTEDGHTVIDGGTQEILVSPDGESAVLYGGIESPCLIEAGSAEELYQTAMEKLETWDDRAREEWTLDEEAEEDE